MRTRQRLMVVLVPTLAATEGRAQIIGPLRQANLPGQLAQECVVAGGRTAATVNELVVAWQDPLSMPGRQGVRYSISHNAGLTWTMQGTLLDRDGIPGADLASDPVLAVDPANRIWLSGIPGNVAWKEPVADDFATSYPATQLQDKPVLAIGPAPDNPSGTNYYLNFTQIPDPEDACGDGWSASTAQPTTGPWSALRVQPAVHPNNDYRGYSGGSVVLSDGRLLIAFRNIHAFCNLYSPELPYIVWSDTAGQTWFPAAVPPGPVIVANGSNIIQTKFTDTHGGLDEFAHFPAIAVDPATSPNYVYVAFHGRAVRGDIRAGDRNSDIYICRSRDGGQTFDGGPGSPDLLQLDDFTLGLDQPLDGRGPDQLVAGMVIDPCGGVNVMFYDNRNDPDLADNVHWFDVYWVRITGFGTASQSIYQARLTSQSFQLSDGFLGHYHTMARAGAGLNKSLYAAFIATAQSSPPSGPWDQHNCYVRRITHFCQADTNLSGFAEADDIALFVDAYLAAPGPDGGFGPADLNGDGVVDERDFDLFCESYQHLAAESP